MTDYEHGWLRGERLPFWIPLMMAIVGAIGSVATAELAVASADSNDKDSSTLRTTTISEAEDTPGAPSEDVSSDATPPESVSPDSTSPDMGTAGDDQRDTNANRADRSTGAADPAEDDDCPPLFVVRFEFASSSPLTEPGSDLDDLASWMADHPEAELLLDGHADAAGSEAANLRLSFRRAEATAALLTEAGMPGERLQSRGFGEYQPIVGEAPDSERNRRVTIQVAGRKDCPIEQKDHNE